MHLHSDKIFFPNSCHHSINTPWNVPKKIMNASSEPKRVNSLVPSVNFLILHIKSYHYQNTNNASFVVYVIQSQHYQNTNNASFVVNVIQSQHHQNTNNASFVVYVFQGQPPCSKMKMKGRKQSQFQFHFPGLLGTSPMSKQETDFFS